MNSSNCLFFHQIRKSDQGLELEMLNGKTALMTAEITEKMESDRFVFSPPKLMEFYAWKPLKTTVSFSPSLNQQEVST